MKEWNKIRNDVDIEATEIRNKITDGKLITQYEAATVRESELYAKMDLERQEELNKKKQNQIEEQERTKAEEEVEKQYDKNNGENLKKEDDDVELEILDIETNTPSNEVTSIDSANDRQKRNIESKYELNMKDMLNQYLQKAQNEYDLDVSVESAYEIMNGCGFDYDNATSKLFGSLNADVPDKVENDYLQINTKTRKELFDKWVIETGNNEYIIKKYLSYNDVLHKNLEEINIDSNVSEMNSDSRQKYVLSFKELAKEPEFFEVVNDIRNRFNDFVQTINLIPTTYGESDTWIYWDMAKQKYFVDHKEDANAKYDIGDPIEDENIQQQIVDRHVGWEVYNIVGENNLSEQKIKSFEKTFKNHEEILNLLKKRSKSNKTLSSYDLTELGKQLREGLQEIKNSYVKKNTDKYNNLTEGFFDEIKNDENQPELTKDIFEDKELCPHTKLEIGDKTFLMGKILRTSSRDQSVMFVDGGDGKLLPRALYKSKSDGGWRSCPGAMKDGLYIKGNIHYTQSTKPHELITQYFNNLSDDDVLSYEGKNIFQKYFTLSADNKKFTETYTFDREMKKYDDDGVLKQFQEYSPGAGFEERSGKKARDFFAELDFDKAELKGFMPDFSNPIRTAQVKHTLLGDTTIEIFNAALDDKNIEWAIASDNDGRVWIDSIKFAGDNSDINSYGLEKNVIDSGLLTNKPLEYSTKRHNQTRGLEENVDMKVWSAVYNDITLLLDNLLPIKKYREARNIWRKDGTPEPYNTA